MAMPQEWKQQTEDGTYQIRTCAWSPPGDHPVGCGILLTVKDGKLVGVEGDEDHPITQGRLCPRCLDLIEYTYHQDRIIYPMKRDPKDRGKNTWEQITWDEAYDMIEAEVRRIKADYGPESIVVYGGTGREACLYYYPLGFATLQTPNVCYTQSGWSCYGPRCSITDYILGAGYPEIDYAGYFEERFDHPDFVVPKYIVNWGKAPLESNGDGLFGHVFIDLMKLGTKIINIDPRITWLGSREGNMTLQLKPGSDTALALGILNVLINEDLYDHEFVENFCYGFDELSERVQEYSPERVEELTWVPADQVREVARILGTNHPCSIAWGLAVDQNPNGVQMGQAIISIAALCNMIDVPGGLTVGPPEAMLGAWRMEARSWLPPELWDKRIGAAEWPGLSTGMATTQPDETLEVLETGKPYEIKMAWYNSSNFLTPTCSAQPHRWYEALKKMEFAVVQDLFMTPTAMALADVFLPLPTFAEHEGVVLPHYGRNTVFVGAMNKALTVGDTRSDIQVCHELGHRLNPDAWPHWEDMPAFFGDQLQAEFGFGFDGLRERGLLQPGYTYQKYRKGLMRWDGEPGFNTVTGRVELYSTLFEAWGEDPLPYYEEPRFSQISRPEWSEEYPLMLTTGARKFTSFHSEHRQLKNLREIDPWPVVELNPEAAEKYGVKEGDWVCVENMFGMAKGVVRVCPTIDARVIHMTHGWWYPEQDGEEPNLFGVWKSNVNDLIPHFETGILGFGGPFKAIMCKVYKVDGLDADVVKFTTREQNNFKGADIPSRHREPEQA